MIRPPLISTLWTLNRSTPKVLRFKCMHISLHWCNVKEVSVDLATAPRPRATSTIMIFPTPHIISWVELTWRHHLSRQIVATSCIDSYLKSLVEFKIKLWNWKKSALCILCWNSYEEIVLVPLWIHFADKILMTSDEDLRHPLATLPPYPSSQSTSPIDDDDDTAQNPTHIMAGGGIVSYYYR